MHVVVQSVKVDTFVTRNEILELLADNDAHTRKLLAEKDDQIKEIYQMLSAKDNQIKTLAEELKHIQSEVFDTGFDKCIFVCSFFKLLKNLRKYFFSLSLCNNYLALPSAIIKDICFVCLCLIYKGYL